MPDELQDLINTHISILKSTSKAAVDSETIKILCETMPPLVLKHEVAATHLYALMHKHGVGVPKSDEQYIKYLAQAILLGKQDAEDDFWNSTNPDCLSQMREFAKEIADSGNATFARSYAACCEFGMGGNKDIPDAIKYYKIAASSGIRACKRSANMLEDPDDRLKVKQPYFFRINYRGKIAYLLGTIHIVGWNVFPKAMQEIIRSCSSVISESSPSHQEDISTRSSVYVRMFTRNTDDLDWFALLPPELQKKCKELWHSHLSINPSDLSEIADVKVGIVQQHLEMLTRSNATEILEDALEQQYNNIRNIYGSMDVDIEKVLQRKGGLEDTFRYDKLAINDEGTDEEAAFAKLLLMLRAFTGSSSPDDNFIRQELLDCWEEYASGRLLHDLALTLKEEQEYLLEGDIQFKRNAIMHDSALDFINNLAGPILITCGLNHFLGITGLLTTLAESGALLELYDGNTNSFKPYVYPYKPYLTSLVSIKRGMFFSSAAKFKCTTIILYSSQEEFLAKFKPSMRI